MRADAIAREQIVAFLQIEQDVRMDVDIHQRPLMP